VNDLAVRRTAIEGLLIVDLVVHPDDRGWFKENWQRAKMVALGLPDFGPVQHSLAYNTTVGVTRGFHAEPWDKLVSIAHGRIFGAWVDLRPGAGFGTVVTEEIGPETAVFVPRGVANGYQTLAPETVYSYLVNDHWSPAARPSYSYVNLTDPALGVAWPIPLAQAIISVADRAHPLLADATAVPPKRTVIVGANGQLGTALRELLPNAVGVDLPDFDISDRGVVDAYPWSGVANIINASAYTAVDAAETPQGRLACWKANVTGVANLARVASEHRLKLVHVSSDYVFDGITEPHTEDEGFSPLGVYGQTKAAGDALVAQVPQHYLLRSSWVIGAGNNFVRTMAGLADKGVSPTVVDDQDGRLTFTADLAGAIVHLLTTQAAPGTYNFTNSGPVASWCEIARQVFVLRGRDAADVTAISSEAYAAGKLTAPRPRHSALDLSKIEATGLVAPPWPQRLSEYLAD
jgi:dTDP-4-dehydrorhamnose 3,5-epimerase/reductase